VKLFPKIFHSASIGFRVVEVKQLAVSREQVDEMNAMARVNYKVRRLICPPPQLSACFGIRIDLPLCKCNVRMIRTIVDNK
jgi:hypothetical protein